MAVIAMKPKQVLLSLSPSIILIVVPALLVGTTRSIDIGWSLPQPFNWFSVVSGIMLCLAGLGLMIWTIRLFWEKGTGTLTPFDPTRRLVVSGPYRHVRNPMYLGVFLILYGEGILLGSTVVLAFATLVVLLPVLYVPLVEERGLEERFGGEYRTFKAHVPRWIPRLRPWDGKAENE